MFQSVLTFNTCFNALTRCFNGTHLASVFHLICCCPVHYLSTALPMSYHTIDYLGKAHYDFFWFFSSLRCMHLSVHFPGKQRKGTNWWKSSQILALNTIVSRLFQDWMSRLNILKGKQLEWFHLGLCWHYRRSILLLCCVDIGLQSV